MAAKRAKSTPAAKKPAPNVAKPRTTSSVVQKSPYCGPLRDFYAAAVEANAKSWSQVEPQFLEALSAFDHGLAATAGAEMTDNQRTQVRAATNNGKGDLFNDLLALLLENCAGLQQLYARKEVPGLIVAKNNLDGVYPGGNAEIRFLLEAKMMGTPKTGSSPKSKPVGRMGAADAGKRVKELSFKAIDLKGEHARKLTEAGRTAAVGGAGGGDLTGWLRSNPPRIFAFFGVRVLHRADFEAVLRWCDAAAQTLDAVGLFVYEPVPGGDPDDPTSHTTYRVRTRGIPTQFQISRVLHRACTELQALKNQEAEVLNVAASKAAQAESAAEAAGAEDDDVDDDDA